jgi:hypothetical protein
MAERRNPKISEPSGAEQTDDPVQDILSEPISQIEAEEPVVLTTPDPAASNDSTVTRRPTPKPRGGFLPALGGGVLAACLGFAVSHFNLLGYRATGTELAALVERQSSGEASLAAMQAEIADLQKVAGSPAAPDPTIQDRLATVEAASAQALASMEARLAAVEGQLSALSSLPSDGTGISAAALAALQEEVRALKAAPAALPDDLTAIVTETEQRLAEAQSKARALSAEVDLATRRNTEAVAISQIEASMNTGQPYSDALDALPDVVVPEALTSLASRGVPTLDQLQLAFPAAARSALEAALRANMGESWSERIGTFLRTQTGARSLEPRDGTDPDAVLSRAEAALTKGDLETARQEIATLPTDAQAAMSDWTALAEQRRMAVQAVRDLATEIGG